MILGITSKLRYFYNQGFCATEKCIPGTIDNMLSLTKDYDPAGPLTGWYDPTLKKCVQCDTSKTTGG